MEDQQARDHNLLEEQKADYQWFTAVGSHYDIGFATAQHAGFAIQTEKPLSTEQRLFAEKCRDVVSGHFPELLDECRSVRV